MDIQQVLADWHYPTEIRMGMGRITELAEACRELDIAAPLLVTDPDLSALPMVSDAVANLGSAGLRCGVFSAVRSNPSGSNVLDGVAAFSGGEHDGVIAFGGGSALDAGKAIAFHQGQSQPLFDFIDLGDSWRSADSDSIAPLVAVPTTAGTGSEVGRASVITDEDAGVKRIIFHPRMMPGRVILDPELTLGLPAHLTAATGMDALSHNLEAFCALGFHPMAEGIALEGMRLVRDYLPRACADGSDRTARAGMMVASTMGATAFQRGLGAMHALAHSLGAVYDKHHGLLNAILMPYVLRANVDVTSEAMTRASRYLALDAPDQEGMLQWIMELRAGIGIPHSLAQIGLDDSDAERIGAMAAADPSAAGNPLQLTAGQYSQLFADAVAGRLD